MLSITLSWVLYFLQEQSHRAPKPIIFTKPGDKEEVTYDQGDPGAPGC